MSNFIFLKDSEEVLIIIREEFGNSILKSENGEKLSRDWSSYSELFIARINAVLKGKMFVFDPISSFMFGSRRVWIGNWEKSSRNVTGWRKKWGREGGACAHACRQLAMVVSHCHTPCPRTATSGRHASRWQCRGGNFSPYILHNHLQFTPSSTSSSFPASLGHRRISPSSDHFRSIPPTHSFSSTS